jgi:LysM repeat protein
MTDMPEAVRALEKAAAVEGELHAITVDGKQWAAFSSEADAKRTLELVKEHYEKNIKGLQGNSTFKETVFVEKRYVDTAKFYDRPEDASIVLTSVSQPALMHTVERGDRAVKLAQQYGIPFNQFKKQNPGTNMHQLTEGDQLLIRGARRPITVVSKAVITKTVTVSPPSDARRYSGARTGKRVMRVLATYENGRQVSEEVISQITTWDRPAYSVERTTSRRRR